MKNYIVTITLTQTYEIELEEKNKDRAINKGYSRFHTEGGDKFFSDSDSKAEVEEIK